MGDAEGKQQVGAASHETSSNGRECAPCQNDVAPYADQDQRFANGTERPYQSVKEEDEHGNVESRDNKQVKDPQPFQLRLFGFPK